MKTLPHLLVLSGAAIVLAIATTASAGADKKPAASPTAVRAVPLDVQIPQSVFSQPGGKVKDPFYPNSTRLIPVETNTAPVAISVAEFTLKGLTGIAGQRLAIINNRSLGEGESDEILTPNRKVKIHVLRITEKSAVLRVEGQQESFEIFLSKSLQ